MTSTAAARTAGIRSPRLSRLSDERLARHVERGGEQAFRVLYERYHQPLYRYCRSIVRDDTDAQDALQSAFTGALAALQRGARNAPVRPWLYRIAHNESISLLRRRKRDAQQQLVEDATAVASSAEEQAVDRARWRRVVADLAQLPDRQRGALLLRELAGLSHEEIAVALGVTVGGAKQAIFEARQALADVEAGRAMSCEEVRRRISEGDRRVLRGRRMRAHLRACSACESFTRAIPARQSDLRALAPGLPPTAAAALLGRVIGTASHHGGASAGSVATAGAVGKGAAVLAGWKTLAVAGLVAGTAAGVTGLTQLRHHASAAGRPVAGARAAPPAQAARAAVHELAGPNQAGHRHVSSKVKRPVSARAHRHRLARASLHGASLSGVGALSSLTAQPGPTSRHGSGGGSDPHPAARQTHSPPGRAGHTRSTGAGSTSHGHRTSGATHGAGSVTHPHGKPSATSSAPRSPAGAVKLTSGHPPSGAPVASS